MSGPPFDWMSDDPHPWLFDWEVDDAFTWDWPASVYERCEMDCHLGSVAWGESFWMECPACGGSGLGKEHRC